jgi:hypothetical protein
MSYLFAGAYAKASSADKIPAENSSNRGGCPDTFSMTAFTLDCPLSSKKIIRAQLASEGRARNPAKVTSPLPGNLTACGSAFGVTSQGCRT